MSSTLPGTDAASALSSFGRATSASPLTRTNTTLPDHREVLRRDIHVVQPNVFRCSFWNYRQAREQAHERRFAGRRHAVYHRFRGKPLKYFRAKTVLNAHLDDAACFEAYVQPMHP